ncbi:hypothetical protein EDD15DRAFT_2383678 [Pisolithus albus]|nr:hypothetical protein EDD15DRAFT_2383678 [Pisolithus albus]
MSSPFNPKAINEEIQRRFWSFEPEQGGPIRFGGVTGIDHEVEVPTESVNPSAHEPSSFVRTGDSIPLGHANLGNPEEGTNDALKDAVEQLVHELGSTPCGCAPDPPVGTGADVGAHAEADKGFEKPRSPARSTVSVVRTSVLLDQNRWPAWMHDEPEIDRKSEDRDKFSPKLLWSDLVQNEEELRNSVPQWYGIPSTGIPEKDKTSRKSVSEKSMPRLTKDAKEKWKAPGPTETANEVPNNNDGPETAEPMEQTIRRLRETGLVEQLDSAEAVIRQQQAIIESLKRQKKRESIRPGPSGLNAKQKQRLGDRVINSDKLETKVSNETQEEPTANAKLGSETAKASEPLNREKTVKPHRQKNKENPKKETHVARASYVFPRESTVLRAMHGDPSENSSSSDSDDTEQGRRGPNDNAPYRRPIVPNPSSGSSDDSSSSSSEDDFSFGSDFLDEEPSSVLTDDSDRTKARKREKKHRYCAKLNKLKYQQSFLKDDPPFTYRGEIQVGLFKKWCRELRDWVKRARLDRKKSIRVAGKYLDGRAYRFYERNVLDLKKKYSLTTFFEDLFDYVFPADFRMQQRDKFDACRQDGRSVLDFLRRLQEIADTVGDISDKDVVLAFWRRCQPYLRAELTRNGYDATTISIVTLESECVRYEKAKRVIDEDRNRRPQQSRD